MPGFSANRGSLGEELKAARRSQRSMRSVDARWQDEGEEDFVGSPEGALVSEEVGRRGLGFRGRLKSLVENQRLDTVMGVVIIANVALMAIETNTNAQCFGKETGGDPQDAENCSPAWMFRLNIVFQVVYTVELVFRLFALGKSFFRSKWNLGDLFIVTTGWLDMIITIFLRAAFNSVAGGGAVSPQIFRVFRLARLMRVARILTSFPELYIMLRGFMGAMMAMFWGMFMIMVLLLLWSIVTVEVVNESNRNYWDARAAEGLSTNPWCEDAFSSVWTCILFFFQTVFAGDSWGSCAIPLIRDQFMLFIIFAGALITIQLGFTNLVLAVIMDKANKAHSEDVEQRVKERMKEQGKNSQQLHRLITQIDTDNSGSISKKELMSGFKRNKELSQLLMLMDVHPEDLEQMFDLIVDEKTGEVQYGEFVQNLAKAESQDLRRNLMMMGLQLSRIVRKIEAPLDCPAATKEQKLKQETTLMQGLLNDPGPEMTVRDVQLEGAQKLQSIEASIEELRRSIRRQFDELGDALAKERVNSISSNGGGGGREERRRSASKEKDKDLDKASKLVKKAAIGAAASSEKKRGGGLDDSALGDSLAMDRRESSSLMSSTKSKDKRKPVASKTQSSPATTKLKGQGDEEEEEDREEEPLARTQSSRRTDKRANRADD